MVIAAFLLSLPRHTSHKLQPLDPSFFKGMESGFNVACNSWLRKHPARRITVDKLGELFSEGYLKSATVENAVSGFKTTGIHPFNFGNIPGSEYLQDPREAGSTKDRAATMEPISGPSNQRIEATQNQHHATTMEPTPGPSNESLDLFVITSTASTSDPELELSFDKILSVPKIVAI
eukprot:gene11459-12657_t